MDHTMEAAIRHLQAVETLAKNGQIAWKALAVPRPGAMRAFEGRSGPYLLLVTQSNIVGMGVQCMGMLTVNQTLAIKLTSPFADSIYHLAAATQN